MDESRSPTPRSHAGPRVRPEGLDSLAAALVDSDEVILRATTEDEVFDRLCRVIVGNFGLPLAWVGLSEPGSRRLLVNAADGAKAGYLEEAGYTRDGLIPSANMVGRALRTGQAQTISDLGSEPEGSTGLALARAHGLRSTASFPLRSGRTIIGALQCASDAPGYFDEQVVGLLGRLAASASTMLAFLEHERKRREVEQNLTEGRQKQQGLFDLAPVAIMVLWADRVEVNDALLDMFGYRDEASFGAAGPLAIVDPTDPDARNQLMSFLHAQSSETRILQMAGRRADGSAFQMLLEGVAFKDMEPSNRVVFVTDVTDLENAVASSRQSKARLKAILDNAPVALLSLDLDGIIRSWNPAAARIFGRTEAQAVGSPGPGGHITAGNVKRMATGGLPHLRGELVEHARVDRTKVEVRILTATLLDPDGEPSELLVVAEDVTALALIDAERTRLVAAIDQSSESIVITDPAATIQYVNPAFERLTGYTRADAIGKNPRILQSGVQEPAFYQAMWAILKRGETWRGTFVNRARDGRLFEEEAAISPVFDSNGRLINYVAVKRDVTRERAADVALRRSEERYRNLVDFANDAIFIRDIDGRFIDANQTACERLGYTRDQLLTMSVADIDSPTDAAELADRTEAILRQGSAVFESAHVARNGTVIPTEMSSTVIEHAGRKAILSIARDITDRRRIQTALELSEAKFSTAFKTSPDSININRISDGLYLDISEGFTEMTGFTRADVQGKTSADISLWADSGAREKAVELLLADGALRNLEMRFRRKDGTVGLGLMSGRVIEVDGEACILSITRDITERKAAERRFEMLFNLASDAIMISEPGGRFVDVNRKACERLGYSRDELLAMSPADINAPEFAALAQAWTQDLLRNGSAFIATVHVRKDGTSIPVEISTTVVDLGGRTAILSIVRDVTERKSAEAAQRRSELKYSTAFRTFPDAVNITRLSDGRFLEINDGFSAMFRIRPGRGPGQDARRVRAVGRSDGACPAGGATSGRRVIRRCGGSVPPQRRQRGNRSDVGQDHGPRWREVHPGDHAQHHRPAPCPGAVPDALRVGQRRDLHPRRRGPVPRGEPDRLRPSWLHPR